MNCKIYDRLFPFENVMTFYKVIFRKTCLENLPVCKESVVYRWAYSLCTQWQQHN